MLWLHRGDGLPKTTFYYFHVLINIFFYFHNVDGNRHKREGSYGEVNVHEDPNDTSAPGGNAAAATAPTNGSAVGGSAAQPVGQGMPSKVTKVKNNEKTLLLSSDDEFQ